MRIIFSTLLLAISAVGISARDNNPDTTITEHACKAHDSSSILSTTRTTPYWLGADIGGTTGMEAHGHKLYNAAGEERENTALMKELGMNAIRLRVWVNPKDGFCSKEDVLKMAQRAKNLGMEIMLTFHYSDSWADPGKQPIPEKWKNYDYKQMKKAVATHTRETLELLKNNGINVKWMQLGNETTDGMLWEMGRASTNMEQYAGLSEAAYKAAKKVFPDITCIVHLDCGMDINRYNFILDGLNKYNSNYDMIGMSVYPYWDMGAKLSTDESQTLKGVVDNIKTLSSAYGKPIMIAEVGYEAKRANEGYAFIRKLIDSTLPLEQCQGIFYWAPELEGAYPLGAFEKGKPTKILDAFTETAHNLPAQDTTFYSTRRIDCRSDNGLMNGEIYLPYSSEYIKNGRLPIVILSPDYGSSKAEMEKYAKCLASNGIAAYTFDLQQSTKDCCKVADTDTSASISETDLTAITSMLSRMPNINPAEIILSGCGKSVPMSIQTAAAHPESYKALIMLYPTLTDKDEGDAAIKSLEIYNHPILLIYGEEDPLTSTDIISELKERVKNLDTFMIEKGKHSFPDAFNHRQSETYVLNFIRDILQ